ncbi:DUF6779 domain-containing protein [Corynebacterium pelargi]|uniref:Uncharacterized protein n=1 Tax=Corynebacterium pelargi TaxID=1471400 RepID=A0A410W6N1_9CORY|nr:DUF6779 domain-containing protein [Corynebacterium pelargi]QAU51625.1 hypothetical protein CPELA_01630 [Corynebacterium pelargi]GGG80120.1 hypothetical protein GCM10007338_18170 [Corynebacterium pelargi]
MNEKDNGQKVLIALVVLALIASVVMMVTGNLNALKLALLAALWAAALGLLLVVRYRQQAIVAREELERSRAQFEEELAYERELEQHREYEYYAEIRAQLDELRFQLEDLTGQLFEEPTMLEARATRVHELESAEEEAAAAEEDEPTPGYPSQWATHPSGPISSFLLQEDETHEFDVAALKESAPEPQEPEEPEVPEAPEEEAEPETPRHFDTGSFHAVPWVQVQPEPEPEPEPEQPVRHGRRRRDEHSEAVSVEELLRRQRK